MQTFEPMQRAVYTGREYMGRCIQIGPKNFEAFDASGHQIGVFPSIDKAVAAIGICWRPC
jgi:hypothetical protein